MARRLAVIGLLVVLSQLATGCHICEHIRAKKAYKQAYRGHHGFHGYVDPCACSCSSPHAAIDAPVLPAQESLPIPKKMPATTMNPKQPILTSYDK